jgi:methylmalonyl-CoA/ethylmalonyl-CoA epimerase
MSAGAPAASVLPEPGVLTALTQALPVATRLHHVGIIMPDAARMLEVAQLLGLGSQRTYYVEAYQADCHFMAGGLGGPGGAAVEFIVPRGGKLAQFNRGAGGLHHLALEVTDLLQASELLQAQGIRLLEPAPVPAGPLAINFVPPAYTWGLIVEIVQCNTPPSSP